MSEKSRRKYLISETTREEREALIKEELYCGSIECEGCQGCGIYGLGDMYERYLPYINGDLELAEINKGFPSGIVK